MVRTRLCRQHTIGREYPVEAATFDPECPKCKSLLAEGKRTGKEAHPMDVRSHVMEYYIMQDVARVAEAVHYARGKRRASA